MSKSQICMFNTFQYNNSSILQIRGQVLPQCSHSKLLGIVIDDKLSFPAHITTVCNENSRNIDFIKKNTALPSLQSQLSSFNVGNRSMG